MKIQVLVIMSSNKEKETDTVDIHKLAAKNKNYTGSSAREDLLYDNTDKNYSPLLDGHDQRTVFQHDCDAILYSKSFRRLMRKTQVTYPGTTKNEHTRTRLTHTLEVMQIARAITQALKLNSTLAEAISLGHDIGHTPFGHEGEQFLDKICYGIENEGVTTISLKEKYNLSCINFDFKHNYQSVRVLMTWEGSHYDKDTESTLPGLNISKQTLEGILKHSKIRRKTNPKKGYLYRYPEIIRRNHDFFYPERNFAVWSVEAQIVGLADEIAQVCHDLDDAIVAEYSVKKQLYDEIKAFLNNPKNKKYYEALKLQTFIYNDPCDHRISIRKDMRDASHQFISWVIGYLISVSQTKIAQRMSEYCEKKEAVSGEYFPLTEELAGETVTLGDDELFKFLKKIENKYIINNVRINRENGKADFILKSIIEAYLNNPKQLPDSVLGRYSADKNILPEIKVILDGERKDSVGAVNIRYAFGKEFDSETLKLLRSDPVFLRYIWDYIASMTDQYALNEYKMLYLSDPAYNDAF